MKNGPRIRAYLKDDDITLTILCKPRKFPFWKREREAKMASLVPKNKQLLLCITFFTVIISWYQVWCDLTASNVYKATQKRMLNNARIHNFSQWLILGREGFKKWELATQRLVFLFCFYRKFKTIWVASQSHILFLLLEKRRLCLCRLPSKNMNAFSTNHIWLSS